MSKDDKFKPIGDFDDFIGDTFRRKRNRAPFYDDNADYNTNAKSYYDYLARQGHLLKRLAERLWYYDEELAKRFEEWDKNLEEFPENVEKLLIEWLKDGTLEEIINKNIFGKLNDKIDKINQKLNRIFINIDEFDGSDCEKIQKALNKARLLGGGTVYVPRRHYNIDCELVIYKNTTLYSERGTYYSRRHKGYMIMNGNRGDTYNRYEGHGNISIINGTWDGKAQDDLGGVGSNIAFAHADGLHFDNVTVLNANSHSIEINSSKNVVVENSKFLGQLSSLQYVEAIQLDLATKNGFGAFGSYDATPCKNVTIRNNVFGASDDLPAISRGIGTHAVRIGEFMEDIKVYNNEFNGLRDFSIQFLTYKDSIIRDNVFFNCTGGVVMYSSNPDNDSHITDKYGNITDQVQPCSNIIVENNTFERVGGKQVIYCYGRETSKNDNITIRNNTLRNCVDNSGNIMVRFTDYPEIINNKIERVDNFPIFVRSSNHVKINENTINNSGGYSGIRVIEKNRYVQILNNLISRVGGNGINVLTDNYTFNISGNIIVGANGNKEDYDAIYIHSDGGYIAITNNVMRNLTSYQYERGIYVTATIENGTSFGNMAEKGNNDSKYALGNLESLGDI